jgi:hypothetical protein
MPDEIHSALLLLLGMERSLLSLHPLNQFLDPIKHRLVGDAGRHVPVMLDLAVEFDALVTHGTHLKVTGGKQRPPAIL